MSNKPATIQKILSVENHPNADRLDIVKVLRWSVITKKDEFKEGTFVFILQ